MDYVLLLRTVAKALDDVAKVMEKSRTPAPTPKPTVKGPAYNYERWLTIAEAAKRFGVSRSTVDRRIATGEWPVTRLPGMKAPRFSPDDIATIERLR